MSRTNCSIINNSGLPVVMVNWICRNSNGFYFEQRYQGDHWGQFGDKVHEIGPVPTTPNNPVVIGTIGDPGYYDDPQYGWLYFDLVRPDGTRLHLQAFIDNKYSGIEGAGQVSLGYYNPNATKDNPHPSGTCGSAQGNNSAKTATYTLTADLATQANPPQPPPNVDVGTSKGVDFYGYVGPEAKVTIVAICGDSGNDWQYIDHGQPATGVGTIVYKHFEITGTGPVRFFCIDDGRFSALDRHAEVNGVSGKLSDPGDMGNNLTQTSGWPGQQRFVGGFDVSWGFRDSWINERNQLYVFASQPHTAWQGQLVKPGSADENKPFICLALPGAHDAGSSTTADPGMLDWIEDHKNLVAALFLLIPYGPLISVPLLAASKSIIARCLVSLSNTQRDTPTGMLNLGARYFDFRPGYAFYNCFSSPVGTLISHQHTILPGCSYFQFLLEVLMFLYKNPTEIVVVQNKDDGFVFTKDGALAGTVYDTMVPEAAALDAIYLQADAAARAAVPNAAAIVKSTNPAELRTAIKALRDANKRLFILDMTWKPEDSYDDSYHTVDPKPVMTRLEATRTAVAGTDKDVIFQLQATASVGTNVTNAVVSQSDATSVLLSTKALLDSNTYPWMSANTFTNKGVAVFLNDFFDPALTEHAIHVSKARLAALP